MNLTFAQFFGKHPQHSFWIVGRLLSLALGVLLASAASALAEPVRINQVVQTLTSSQSTSDLRIGVVSQDPGAPKGATQQSGPRTPATGGKTESLLSGLTVTTDTQDFGVDITEEGEVEGTICDCGEILVAGGGIAKWPFVFLAAVPLVFIHDCEDCDTPVSSPTPTPPSNPISTPTPTPEPASLMMFGTGLLAAGAGLRRRHTRTKLAEQRNVEEGE